MRKAGIVAVVVVALLAGLFIIGLVAGREESGVKTVEREGPVTADEASAGCLPVERAKVPKEAAKHVNGEVDYDDVPPSHGDHAAQTLRNTKRFYSREDNPPPERAVHNLEHGLVVAWYDDELPADQLRVLEESAQGISTRYVVVPWRRSTFEDDRHFVLTAWGVTQRCRTVSEAVIRSFVENHADTDAPEKGYPV